jgi:hypothetical protein
MAQNIILKRSTLPGKVPTTTSLNVGEIAVNTYDGKLFIKRSGSIESIQEIITTNTTNTGSITLTQTGSFGELVVTQDVNVARDLYVTNDIIGAGDIDISGDITGSSALLSGSLILSGSQTITDNLTVLGTVNARQFNISVISSSVLFQSGSTKFGDTSDDTHDFTGSVGITGSLYLNGVELGGSSNSGSFTGSFSGDGSGLRGVVSDDLPIDGWDYESNSSASISEFNNESKKYIIDFQWEEEVGTPIGFKTFISNVTGSSQIIPTEEGIKFIVGNQQVALVGPNGIESVTPNGTVSGSSQLTSSYDERYVLSGSITQTTWDNIASKPNGIVSSSSQIIGILDSLNTYTASVSTSSLATTGSNTFVGTQTHSGSIIPATDNTYDLGSPTYQWRDIYVSSGSLYIDGTKVLSSTNQELQITTDEGQSIKILEEGSDSIILQSADGDIQLKTSGGGNLLFDPTTGLIDVRGTLQIQDGNKITSSGGNSIQFGDNIVVSGSIESTGNINGVNLTTFSSSIVNQIASIQTNTGSSNIRLDNLENKTGSYATTGSNTFYGTQTFSGSVYIANDLIVQGSSSIQYISASEVSIGTNIVQLNTANPSVRFAGLSIIDSGSVGGSGSFLYDSLQDEFIFVHRGNGTNVTSSHFILGPETYDNLGNETYLTANRLPKGTGIEHLVDSNITDNGTTITLGSNTIVSGTLSATETTLVSGSSQITFSGISSLPTLVSGSSQITLSSTTGYGSVLNQAVLTTSSPTFAGGTFTGDVNSGTGFQGRYSRIFEASGQRGGMYPYNVISGAGTDYSIGLFSESSLWLAAGGGVTKNLNIESNGNSTFSGNVLPAANGTQDLGSATNRWSTVYTSDLSLNNGIGDWTIVEGEDDLFLYNNKKGKVYKFALTEVDPSIATPKIS